MKSTLQTAWNTGAHYTTQGQRIAAALIDGKVYFADVDRMIDGVCRDEGAMRVTDERSLRARAQRCYDYGKYDSILGSTENMEDAMTIRKELNEFALTAPCNAGN